MKHLFKSLAAFQQEVPVIHKGTQGYGYSYADLPKIFEVVNIVQKNTWQMKGEYLYNLYKDLIPQQYKFLKYIKASKKSDYKKDDIYAVKTYFEVSEKQAKEYIDMLPEDELRIIKQQIDGICN